MAGLLSVSTALGQYTLREPNAIPLHGTWQFALDPADGGAANRWYSDSLPAGRFDKVAQQNTDLCVVCKAAGLYTRRKSFRHRITSLPNIVFFYYTQCFGLSQEGAALPGGGRLKNRLDLFAALRGRVDPLFDAPAGNKVVRLKP